MILHCADNPLSLTFPPDISTESVVNAVPVYVCTSPYGVMYAFVPSCTTNASMFCNLLFTESFKLKKYFAPLYEDALQESITDAPASSLFKCTLQALTDVLPPLEDEAFNAIVPEVFVAENVSWSVPLELIPCAETYALELSDNSITSCIDAAASDELCPVTT